MMTRQTSHTISGPMPGHWIKVDAYSSRLKFPHNQDLTEKPLDRVKILNLSILVKAMKKICPNLGLTITSKILEPRGSAKNLTIYYLGLHIPLTLLSLNSPRSGTRPV